MKYMKQVFIIIGITMAGEVLNSCLPLPIPAGVYGVFLMLIGLCTGIIKVSDVEDVGNFLLELMPMMFIPVSVGLLDSFHTMKAIFIPLIVISAVSTVIVMAVTGKMTELIIKMTRKGGEKV